MVCRLVNINKPASGAFREHLSAQGRAKGNKPPIPCPPCSKPEHAYRAARVLTSMRDMDHALRELPSLRTDSVATLYRPSTSASSCMHSSSSGGAGAPPCCPPAQQAHWRPTAGGDKCQK